jgi:shikimate kinase / 3-dehydroquinate synthase
LGPALGKHVALIGFMGAGKSTVAQQVAQRLGRFGSDLDAMIEHEVGNDIPAFFTERGEEDFRRVEEELTIWALGTEELDVYALGGGAVLSKKVREQLKETAVTVWLDVDVETCWERVKGGDRPLAQDEGEFRRLYEERRELYRQVADARAGDTDDVVLAAGAVTIGSAAELDGQIEVVADEHVLQLHGFPGPEAPVHTVPAGEPAKTLEHAARLWSQLRLDPGGTLVAFGGGSTTDLAGFVAATYMRGVDWIAVPTTLVGQVDAAIGGKTAIDLPEGKNLVGAFHWPARTVIDTRYLATLSEEQRANGMAEVVKTGLLSGEAFWELPEAELVRRCAAFKTAVCLRDPYDRGDRRLLNLGHTFAHALEAGSGFRVAHGKAVALGLLAALRLSGRPTDVVEEVLAPVRVRVDRERAWEALQRDKKGRFRLVLLGDDGGYVTEVPEADVRRALDELIAD